MFQTYVGRCVSFIARPMVAAASMNRASHADDDLARLDDGLLRDIGVDRCQIRSMPPFAYRVPARRPH
jgi:uncharacterized protein YjiS (DUF1127 family)